MSTRPETMDFLLDQLGDLPGLRTRRMFGEYCVYVDDKPVGFVCDDQLYVKPTPAGEALLDEPVWGKFYEKAKPHLLLTPDRWDEHELLRALLLATADALPAPRPKKPRQPRAAGTAATAPRKTRATATKATKAASVPAKAPAAAKKTRARKPS